MKTYFVDKIDLLAIFRQVKMNMAHMVEQLKKRGMSDADAEAFKTFTHSWQCGRHEEALAQLTEVQSARLQYIDTIEGRIATGDTQQLRCPSCNGDGRSATGFDGLCNACFGAGWLWVDNCYQVPTTRRPSRSERHNYTAYQWDSMEALTAHYDKVNAQAAPTAAILSDDRLLCPHCNQSSGKENCGTRCPHCGGLINVK